MTERSGKEKIIIRLIEERDVKGVIEVLSTEDFWRESKGFPERLETAFLESARKTGKNGPDKYNNTIVAATKEKAVGRLLVDTNYPPYSELAS